MKSGNYKLSRKKGDTANRRRAAFTAKLCRGFLRELDDKEKTEICRLVSHKLEAHSIDAIKLALDELRREKLELRMLTLLINPDWISPKVGKLLKPIFERVFDRKRCNDDCKYMYFCALTKGHGGLHRDQGLVWD